MDGSVYSMKHEVREHVQFLMATDEEIIEALNNGTQLNWRLEIEGVTQGA